MTDKMIPVPRELLEELRDCASDCFHYESTLSYSRSTRVNFYEGLVEQCDALLGNAAKGAEASATKDEACPRCGHHPNDLTTAWLDGAHCSGPRLSDPAVQKRLAAQWGYVKPDDDTTAQPEQITPRQLAKMVKENPDLQFSVKPSPDDEELRRDAERYRWLRRALSDRENGKSHWLCCIPRGRPEELDTPIDAALAAEKRECE